MTIEEIHSFEKDVIAKTDFYFPADLKGQNFVWYGVFGSMSIEPFHILSQALSANPDYIILKRGTRERCINIYYTSNLEVTAYIPFGEWKLFPHRPIGARTAFTFWRMEWELNKK